MNNELQKEDFILPGDLGEMDGRKILKTESDYRKGTLTITMAPKTDNPNPNTIKVLKYIGLDELVKSYLDKKSNTEDADFEVVPQKQIPEA